MFNIFPAMNDSMNTAFGEFFRSTQANKGYWGSGSFFGGKERSAKTIPASGDDNFVQVWKELSPVLNSGDPVNIWQYLAVTCIMINETGGTFVPISEMGGLKYMFGTNGGKKKSYNTYPANKTAYDQFNNPVFTEAHKDLPNYEYVITKGKSIRAWAGTSYPSGFSDDEEKAGIIAEADFYKFRGRGLIQTTFRDNYTPLIKQVLNYTKGNPLINKYKNQWVTEYGGDPDKIAHASRNADWDDLFMHTDLEFAALSVKAFFDKREGCLDFKMDKDYYLKGKGAGSLYYVGLKVGGTDNYGQVLRARILQTYEGMKKAGLLKSADPKS